MTHSKLPVGHKLAALQPHLNRLKASTRPLKRGNSKLRGLAIPQDPQQGPLAAADGPQRPEKAGRLGWSSP